MNGLFDFTVSQQIIALLIFIWSGFVRSGFGFGGAALSLPLLLLLFNQPLFWLPIIGLHLLFFSALTLRNRIEHIDWALLKKTSVIILPAKLIGVFGLLQLPNQWLVMVIYSITLIYAFLWMLNFRVKGGSKRWVDHMLLAIGGYFSGTSLTGAPLLAAVYASMTDRARLRDTLFLLWFVLVSIKLTTLAAFDVDLQFTGALVLLPAAGIGHVAGLKVHTYILQHDLIFKRVMGGLLMLICITGLSRLWFST